MPKKSLSQNKKYRKLIADLRDILAEGRQQAREALSRLAVATHWKMGKRICKDYPNSVIAPAPVISNIAEDLDLERSALSRSVKLYRLWPEGLIGTSSVRAVRGAHTAQQLSWGHYEALMVLADKEQRQFYLEEAIKNNWSRDLLRQKIKDGYFTTTEAQKKTEAEKKNKKKLKRKFNKLHLYSAYTKRVIDGDTFIARIDLGFNVWIEQRIRLRGIDCPEISTEEGRQAKRFTEGRLPTNRQIVLQTFKTDLHGRYVADVFFLEGETDKEFIASKGNFLNQELLDAGLARLM